ncbi:hypothetical protein GGI12_006252, partial [Dipsacomyces acuminosporus]
GATPYATVSSRISQHFKRILEHIPPRPPILGRVAHEKHTRKYFYYVASGIEQEEFVRKVKAGLIPTPSATGSNTPRRSKSAKKTRCMVPAVAVESDILSIPPSPTSTATTATTQSSSPKRRSRRAASADETNTMCMAKRSSSASALHNEPSNSSGAGASLSLSSRSRRTSYNGRSTGGSHASNSSGGTESSSEDSDSNPYARKRYKSVRSAVAQAYPRRKSSR